MGTEGITCNEDPSQFKREGRDVAGNYWQGGPDRA